MKRVCFEVLLIPASSNASPPQCISRLPPSPTPTTSPSFVGRDLPCLLAPRWRSVASLFGSTTLWLLASTLTASASAPKKTHLQGLTSSAWSNANCPSPLLSTLHLPRSLAFALFLSVLNATTPRASCHLRLSSGPAPDLSVVAEEAITKQISVTGLCIYWADNVRSYSASLPLPATLPSHSYYTTPHHTTPMTRNGPHRLSLVVENSGDSNFQQGQRIHRRRQACDNGGRRLQGVHHSPLFRHCCGHETWLACDEEGGEARQRG